MTDDDVPRIPSYVPVSCILPHTSLCLAFSLIRPCVAQAFKEGLSLSDAAPAGYIKTPVIQKMEQAVREVRPHIIMQYHDTEEWSRRCGWCVGPPIIRSLVHFRSIMHFVPEYGLRDCFLSLTAPLP